MSADQNFANLSPKPDAPFNVTLAPIRYFGKSYLGSLDKIDYVTRLGIYVASADGFTDQHLVGHGASQVVLNVFGPLSGAHSRTAIGVKSLPLNSPVEVDAIFAIK